MFKPAWVMWLLTIALSAVLTSSPLYAQQATQPPAQQEQDPAPEADASEDAEENTEEPAEESTDEQAASNLPDIDNQPIQPGAGGPGRFIPSEQISQDLGVSFPVDI